MLSDIYPERDYHKNKRQVVQVGNAEEDSSVTMDGLCQIDYTLNLTGS